MKGSVTMKKAKNVKVGDVVKFPSYEFAPYRQGWNGWLFEVAIVKRLYTSKSGKKCAELVYQTRNKEYTETTHKELCDYLFEFDLEWARKSYYEHGIKGEGFELLESHGLI